MTRPTKRNFPFILTILLSITSVSAQAQADFPTQTPDSDLSPPYQISDRGQDHAVYRRVFATTDEAGNPILKTNQFTLVENALHYRDANTGEWRESEDIIESFPEGAVARRGPNKVIFAHELNSETVFDLQASDGKRIRGGVRAIRLTDSSRGETIPLGTVKNSVTAELLPQVFATGSMEWNYGLDDFGYYSKGYYTASRVSSVARQMTHNVIRKFTGNSTTHLP